jgi:ferredoxin--NADP+ reductase
MLMICGAAAGFAPTAIMRPVAPFSRGTICRMQEDALRTFLLQQADVSEKFVDQVMEACDAEMIGGPQQLKLAADAGLLPSMFKPVVRLGIERALGASAPVDVSAAAAAAKQVLGPTVTVPTSLLEVDPYHAIKENLPLNTYKNKAPLTSSITSVKRIVGANAPGEVCHVKINCGPTFRYWEGQSMGVIPPGEDPKKPGKPHAVRLYSIASTRYGDDLDGNSVSLCVRRAVYWDKEMGKEDPAKKGVCSNFMCDATPGTKITMTGPTGKVMLIPEETPNADLIMVATGTGIAPYRGFIRRLFVEETPANAAFTGLAWLVLGVPTTEGLLYDEDWQEIAARKPDNFRLTYAISREQTTGDGGKMYVQDRLAESAEELFNRLDNGAHIYFCGLKGMMPSIIETLKGVAEAKGLSWDDKLEGLKKNGQWHVEVY